VVKAGPGHLGARTRNDSQNGRRTEAVKMKAQARSAEGSAGPHPLRFFRRLMEVTVFLIAFFVLLVMWAMGFLAFHVAGGLIHILIVLAVISLIVHLFRGRTT
jgi:hypothetical protein